MLYIIDSITASVLFMHLWHYIDINKSNETLTRQAGFITLHQLPILRFIYRTYTVFVNVVTIYLLCYQTYKSVFYISLFVYLLFYIQEILF